MSLYSAFAIADFNSFPSGSHAAFGVYLRIAIASSQGLFLMRSSTICTLRGAMRTWVTFAVASIRYTLLCCLFTVVGSFGTGVAAECSGRREFAELVAYHILRNVNRHMFAAVMDCKCVTDKVGEYSRAAAP